MIEAIVFLAAVAAIGIAGIRIGLAIAPRVGAWIERQEESGHDDD